MHLRQRKKQHSTKDTPEDLVKDINAALRKEDVAQLRKIAKTHGLVNGVLRKRAWPLLLGIQHPITKPLPKRLKKPQEGGSCRAGRDVDTITMDVARCLHHTNGQLHDQNRNDMREALVSLLAAVVDAETVFYYQGFHEIAAVILLQVGQNVSYHMLVHLAQTHLRDCTRQSLDAVIESLQLLYPMLKAADPKLADHIISTGIPPFFAISWLITWFAHHVSQDMLARLFDLFIASHPLMPMYMYVEGMREVRQKLLNMTTMEEMHTFLVNFNVFEDTEVTVDEMVRRADALMSRHPPLRLYRQKRIHASHSCIVEARLEDGVWWVPEQPPGTFWEAPVATVLESVEQRRMFLNTGVSAGVAALAAAVWVLSNTHLKDVHM